MAGILSVQQIQGLATAADPTTVEISSGHTLYAPGHVLQVKHHTIDPGSQSTTSTSLVNNGLNITITPHNANSSFLIMMSMNECYIPGAQNAMGHAIHRDGHGTVSGDTDNGTIGYITGASNNYFNYNLHCYDSPNTTSAVTYRGKIRSRYANTTIYWNGDNTPTFLTVMEIAG